MLNPHFVGQTLALVKKNFTVTIKRKWFSTLLRSLILPILLLVLLLEIKNFSSDPSRYGIGEPHALPTVKDSLRGSGPLVIATNSSLGPDFPPVLDRLLESLGPSANVIQLEDPDESKLNHTCPVDYHGRSPCHAVVLFNDSPKSGHPNATWAYEIRTDPALQTYHVFDAFNNKGSVQTVILPLQATVENAITNRTEIPDVQVFTRYTQEEAEKFTRKSFQELSLYILSFVFFITMSFAANHLASIMSHDRATGMSQLIDAMGGTGAAWSRVMSYIITVDLLYLPLWIIMGAVFQALLLPSQNAGIVIFWQIFTGLSVTSAAAFGATFFKGHAFATLWGTLIPIVLAVIAAFTENLNDSGSLAQTVVLALLFPSMNYVYFFNVITKAEIQDITLNLGTPLPREELLDGSLRWSSIAAPYFLWIILIGQIIIFPMLAVLVENWRYGNNRKGRAFNSTPEAVSSQTAIQAQGLSKYYRPSWLRKICCCCCGARKAEVKAVDGLDLASYRNQVLCLLGPNGSGKTTTLDMLAGFQTPTDGSITLNASPSQIGVCPQKNTLWDNLTVYEHLVIWNAIKGNSESTEGIEQLIHQCDIAKKRNSLAGSLSGGMKRKLQLACMLVGGSSMCFADEITSGLDPLSRRAIWEVIKRERSRRTMVITTHFLDESEVLSDHIVIITLGKLKCQGTPAELKTKYGGGYRVHIPKTEDISSLSYPVTERSDRYICKTPDSSSAARILSSLTTSKDSELYITGPTIEDVFLKVAEEPHALVGDSPEDISVAESLATSRSKMADPSPSVGKMYQWQISALFWKRIFVLRSTWWQYLFALAIPIVVPALIPDFLFGYKPPQCDELVASANWATDFRLYDWYGLAFGPPSSNDSIWDVVVQENFGNPAFYSDNIERGPYIMDTRAQLERFIHTNSENITYGGAIWASNTSKPLIAYAADYWDFQSTVLLNVANRALSGMEINGKLGELTAYKPADGGNSVIWIVVVCLIQGLYPAFFSLYPTYEKQSKVRALNYSNGIRPLSILFSYFSFDAIFVIIISVVSTALYAPQTTWFGVGWLFLVQALYGFAATLISYLISFIARSQPSAFLFSVLFMVIMFVLSIIPLVILNNVGSGTQIALDGTAYGLGLIFPIQNLLRAFTIGLNTYIVRCRGGTAITYEGSIYAYGGPILLLLIQIIGLFMLNLWLEGGRISFKKSVPVEAVVASSDVEKPSQLSGRPDVDAETERVMSSDSDLLRMQHISKNYGTFTAVEDVTLGLQEGEILALLGPNGAGKTTALNMIRGDLAPSSGRVYLRDVDVQRNTRLSQQSLGVCPQFDALDLLTVRQHLTFYARCKGVTDVAADVAYVMKRVGIAAHADKIATKLSGGNKRKLSLGIALVGDPPVLLLDEPSSAMDAASKRVLWKTLEAIAPGRSVLLTTHSMEEADALATRAAILARRLLAVGPTEALRRAHANEYLVHLVLRAGPLASHEQMEAVADWVRRNFADVQFEGQNLGGQVRFVVPADSAVPAGAGSSTTATTSFTRYLIETLEARKEELGLDCYTISAATMESVFLRVVKESDAEEDERVEKKPWWRW
ncbi:hypothetical protein GGS20DRAFT_291739 [Poronia punctata]|nr:hypothetical protein GGS20DRAFT_291739 [Poronia punctata]